MACKAIGVTDQTYYRWSAFGEAYGELKIDGSRRLKELEQENAKLKRLVAELSLDNLIIKEALKGR